MKKIFILLFLVPVAVSAQIGGRHVFDFLNLIPSARVAALGGVNITTYDQDVNFGWQNPALVNDSMHNQLSMSFCNYLADISYGYTSYARHFEKIGDFHAGIQYLSYGKMVAADEYGNQLGTFSAKDICFVVGGSRQVNQFRMGLNLKFINSNVQGYMSRSAMAFDLGGVYLSESGLFQAGMVFKNIGFNLSRWNLPEGQHAPLPFESQLGVSAKLKHMPLRFSIMATNLQSPNLLYTDPDAQPTVDLSGNEIVPRKYVADRIFRHFVFGGEFLLTRNFNLRAGYNHLRRQELRSQNRGGVSGFSFGAGVKISKFRIDYSFVSFHAVGGTHNFSISTNFGEFRKKTN